MSLKQQVLIVNVRGLVRNVLLCAETDELDQSKFGWSKVIGGNYLSSSAIFLSLSFFSVSTSRRMSRSLSTSVWALLASSL